MNKTVAAGFVIDPLQAAFSNGLPASYTTETDDFQLGGTLQTREIMQSFFPGAVKVFKKVFLAPV